MDERRRSFLKSPRLVWPLVLLLAVVDAVGIYLLVDSYRAEAAQDAQLRAVRLRFAMEARKPEVPAPPAMIHPPPVATALQSGTLIVISKASQNMFVFNDGQLWASSPVSTGKRRHTTPSGVFPILQKRRHHRSNIYSNAPMPFMQRLTWEGIALHAGYVPGYAASHGCVRLPPAFAEALFKLTSMSKTTVVIGDDTLESDLAAQQFALSAQLPIRSALAPPPDLPAFKSSVMALAAAEPAQPAAILASPPTPAPMVSPPVVQFPDGQTIQLAAAASQAEAEAYWAQLRATRPEISRYQKRVEAAQVNARQVYRLRISGADAHAFCAKLQSEGIGCLNVSEAGTIKPVNARSIS